VDGFVFGVVDGESTANVGGGEEKEDKKGENAKTEEPQHREGNEKPEIQGGDVQKPTLLICTDVPDFNELLDAIILKQVREPFNTALTAMTSSEMQTICPSEVNNVGATLLNVWPMDARSQSMGVFRRATIELVRANKRRAINVAEDMGTEAWQGCGRIGFSNED